MMAPEHALHALTKYAAQESLEAGIEPVRLPRRMFPDGMAVRISARAAFEPAALVVRPLPDLNTMEIPNPVIVVEVLCPAPRPTAMGSSSTVISRSKASSTTSSWTPTGG